MGFQPLDLADQVGDHRKSHLPEARILRVQAERLEKLAVGLAAARLKQREILLREGVLARLVAREQRVHQAIAERIGVDVERRVNEVRNVRPEHPVAVAERDRGPEALRLHLAPDLAQPFGGELALLALLVHLALEAVERDLAHHGVEHVLDLRGEQRLAPLRIGGVVQQRLEGQHLAEHRSRLGQRERRRRHQRALAGGEHLMHAMAQFVSERHHVARLALVVEQHVRVRRRRCRVGERARRLAGPHRRVDPPAVEEAARDPRHLRREPAVGVEHQVARVRPRHLAGVLVRQRRVAVPVGQPLLAQPLRLHRVVAVRQLRVRRAHRRDQRLHHLGLDAVGEVARGGRVGEAPPAVGDLLVLRQRVGDQREQPDVVAERFCDGFRAGLAPGLVLRDEQVQRRFERQGFAVHLERQRRHGFVEQPVERAATGERLLVEQLLDAILKLVRAFAAQIVEPGPVSGERRRLQRLGHHLVVDAVEFELEEQKPGGDLGQRLVHVAIKLLPLRIGGVADIVERGVGSHPADQIGQRLVGAHRSRQRRAGSFGEPALPRRLKRRRLGARPGEVGGEAFRIGRRVEVGEVPFRKLPQVLRACRFQRGCGLRVCHCAVLWRRMPIVRQIWLPERPVSTAGAAPGRRRAAQAVSIRVRIKPPFTLACHGKRRGESRSGHRSAHRARERPTLAPRAISGFHRRRQNNNNGSKHTHRRRRSGPAAYPRGHGQAVRPRGRDRRKRRGRP